MKKIYRFAISLCLIVTLMAITSGCNIGKYANLDSSKPLIVTTLFPQYDFARQLVKEKAEVVLLLSPGVESHDFEPTPSDIILINKADLFIYTGDEMEPWVAKILDSIDNEELTILDVSEGVETICEEENREHNHVHEENQATEDEHIEDDETHEEEHIEDENAESEHDEDGHVDDEHNEDAHDGNIILESDEHAGHDHSHGADPHIWTSPVNAIKMVENIEKTLVEIDSENASFYEANSHEYIHSLEELDNQFRQIVKESTSKTIYFGGRFAMSYFAHEYGLNYVAAFDSCQAESEPSARLIVKIIDLMKAENVSYIFHEEMTDPKAARIIAEEIEGEALLLHSCHNVSKAEMAAGATYLSLMEKNVENLRKALSRDK